jgi:lipid-A-disaccharide synthase
MSVRFDDISADIFITANSPGEISGWSVPVIRELRAKIWRCRITIVILPCQYASGEEMDLASKSGADRCLALGQIKGLKHESGGIAQKRLLLHLGGDVAFSVYLSKVIKCPLWVYASRPKWKFFVDRYFVPDAKSAERFKSGGVGERRCRIVGNLALDSVVLNQTEEETREFLGLPPDVPVLACLTGSRPIEYTGSLTLFVRVSQIVAARFPDLRVIFPLAPTVREELIEKNLADSGISWKGENSVREIDIAQGRTALVVRNMTLEALNCAKLALAVPGTNNLQAAALLVPFIMVLPLDRADEFPLDGLMGIIPHTFPGFRRLKRAYIKRMNEKTSVLSLPNKIAGRMTAPEIRGIFTPHVVARMAIGLLESPEKLKDISRAFFECTHERGASKKIAEDIMKFVKGEAI